MGPASGNPLVLQFNCSVVDMQKTKDKVYKWNVLSFRKDSPKDSSS